MMSVKGWDARTMVLSWKSRNKGRYCPCHGWDVTRDVHERYTLSTATPMIGHVHPRSDRLKLSESNIPREIPIRFLATNVAETLACFKPFFHNAAFGLELSDAFS